MIKTESLPIIPWDHSLRLSPRRTIYKSNTPCPKLQGPFLHITHMTSVASCRNRNSHLLTIIALHTDSIKFCACHNWYWSIYCSPSHVQIHLNVPTCTTVPNSSHTNLSNNIEINIGAGGHGLLIVCIDRNALICDKMEKFICCTMNLIAEWGKVIARMDELSTMRWTLGVYKILCTQLEEECHAYTYYCLCMKDQISHNRMLI